MKVTANIPDSIIADVKFYSKGKNITDALLVALNEWIALKKIINLNNKVEKRPLEFSDHFSANQIRTLNRLS